MRAPASANSEWYRGTLLGSHPSRTDDIATVRRLARPQRGPRLLEPGEATPHTPHVLVLTPDGHEGYAYAALRAGADGFLLEEVAPDELASASASSPPGTPSSPRT